MPKVLFVSADEMAVKTGEHGEVFIALAGLGNQIDLAPGVEVALHLTPDEADRLAAALTRTALLARSLSSQRPSSD